MRSDAQKHHEQLIAAATRVFEREGYNAPLEAVLKEAGLGRGTLYRHFKDRHALIAAVLERAFDQLEAFVEAHAESPGLFPDFVRRHGTLAILVSPEFEDMEPGAAQTLLEPVIRRATHLYTQVIEQARRHGVVSENFGIDEFELIARMLIGATRRESGDARDRRFEGALKIILQGVRTY